MTNQLTPEEDVEERKAGNKWPKEWPKEGIADMDYCFCEEKVEQQYLSNRTIFEKLEAIERKIDLIFGNHVVINNHFQQLEINKKNRHA